MKNYGSIDIKLGEVRGDAITLQGEKGPPSFLVRGDQQRIISRNGSNYLVAAVIVAAVATCAIIGIWSSTTNHQSVYHWKEILAPFVEILLNSHKADWKSYIHNDADPTIALFHDQIVDHFRPHTSGTYQQRYYQNLHYWEGPGRPLFFIIGGEGDLKQILYPFVSVVLAQRFGAATFCPEHRFFGVSYPVSKPSRRELRRQLTPRQAMEDAVHFIKARQSELGCGPRGSTGYCPVVTVGGSYPGLLSALLRINYPDVVDIGYAAGVPFQTWDNRNPQVAAYKYYDKITQVADRESPGCAKAIKDAIEETLEVLGSETTHDGKNISALAEGYGICPNTLPHYIKSGKDFAHAIVEILPGRFSNTNMDYYPPRPGQPFIQDCKAFQHDENSSTMEKFRTFLLGVATNSCYNMGGGDDKEADDPSDKMWDVLCCRLVPVMGRSKESMFPYKKYEMKDQIEECQRRFGITVDPSAMVREFGFSYENLTRQSRILLTNGDNDGWAALSYLHDINDSVTSMNFENGAHHSELLHFLAPEDDTPDVRRGHKAIAEQLGIWLEQVKKNNSGTLST